VRSGTLTIDVNYDETMKKEDRARKKDEAGGRAYGEWPCFLDPERDIVEPAVVEREVDELERLVKEYMEGEREGGEEGVGAERERFIRAMERMEYTVAVLQTALRRRFGDVAFPAYSDAFPTPPHSLLNSSSLTFSADSFKPMGPPMEWSFIFRVCHRSHTPVSLLRSLLSSAESLLRKREKEEKEEREEREGRGSGSGGSGGSGRGRRNPHRLPLGAVDAVAYRLRYFVDLLLYGTFYACDVSIAVVEDRHTHRASFTVPDVTSSSTASLPPSSRSSSSSSLGSHAGTSRLVIRLVDVASRRSVVSARGRLSRCLQTATASYMKSSEYRNIAAQHIALASSFVFYFFATSLALKKVHSAHSQLSCERAQQTVVGLWNKLDDPGDATFLHSYLFSLRFPIPFLFSFHSLFIQARFVHSFDSLFPSPPSRR
jgi:hypothetical protein